MNHPRELDFAKLTNYRAPIRLEASFLATAMLESLKLDLTGELVLYQSPLHCDGFSPLCLTAGEWRRTHNDRLLGHLAGVPLWVSAGAASYWAGCTLVLDIAAGEAPAHSLEHGSGHHFVLRTQAQHSSQTDSGTGNLSTN